ncbi:caspase family protein [Scytonema sp. NUACC26]|uniref:nSTAND1 domain-containing NTPase n=1 Tax=Scytonema sp. NUACC26 TaxID=3140176 RepID=UPI0034DB9B62
MAEFANNLAFVIGINNYGSSISSLQNAVSDAKQLAEILREKHGYQVWECLDEVATLKNLLHLLDTTLPEHTTVDDRLLFYFAGHGIALNGDDGPQGYLIPQDAVLGDTSTYLPMTQLQEYLSQLPCRHFLGIFDCCFAGAFRWSSTRDLLPVPEVIHQERYDRFITDPAWQVITSADYDQEALDALKINTERGSDGEHSPFAAALFEALSGGADVYSPDTHGQPSGDGVITATELYIYLRDRVEGETFGDRLRQTPRIWPLKKHDKGEYIFLTPGHVLNLPPAPPLDESQNPYRGLQSFDEEHSHLFFGRQALTEQLYQHICQQPLTVVLGASGTGKSSLVKAGSIPYLRKLDIAQQHWKILAPIRPGDSPLQALNNTLARENLAVSATTNLTTDNIATWCQNNPTSKLLLVIDQAEELLIFCRQDRREKFLNFLKQLLAKFPQQIRIVLTLRNDFENQFQDSILAPYWQAARFFVPVMTREEWRSCIEEPASARVMYFEPYSLVDNLIDEVAQMPGALPLLSFTLSELYLKYLRNIREGKTDNRAITQEDYEELGGVTRSLTQRADSEYEKLVQQDPAYAQTVCNVMLRMVAVGSEDTRRRVPLSELEYPEPENSRVQEAIKRFTTARLLVEGQDTEGNPYVEPAHDALVQGWQKLQEWKKDREESLTLQRRLTQAAQEWKSKETLAGNHRVENFVDWLDGKFYSVENWFNKINTEFVRLWQPKVNRQERPKDKQVEFLWNSEPYLDVLKEKLNSNPKWFNQLEAEFVQHSAQRRRQNTAWRWRIAITVILGLSGLIVLSLIGQWGTLYGNMSSKTQSADGNLRSNNLTLDALKNSLQAGETLKNPLLQLVKPKEQDRAQVISTLRRAVYTVRESNRLQVPLGAVESIFWLDDKLLMASADNNGTVYIWNKKMEKLRVLEGRKNPVTSIRFSPNNSRLAIAENNGNIRLWDWETGLLIDLKKHQGLVKNVAFSLDGSKLATVGADGTANLWHLSKHLQEFNETKSKALGVGFNVNNQLLLVTVSQDNRIVSLLDSAGKELRTFKPFAPVEKVIISPDGEKLVIFYAAHGNEEASSWLWNWQKNQFQRLGKEVIVSFSKNGKVGSTGFDDGIIRLRDLSNNRVEVLKGHSSQVTSINFRANNQEFATASTDGTIRVWHMEHENLNPLTPLPGKISNISFTPDGKQMAVLRQDGTVSLSDLSGKNSKVFARRYNQSSSLSFTPDGQKLAILDNGTLNLLNLSGKQVKAFPVKHSSQSNFSFRKDGNKVAILQDENTVRVLNLFNGKEEPKHDVNINKDKLRSVVWREKDRLQVASVGEIESGQKSVRLWDLQTNQQIAIPFQGRAREFVSISFDNDGNLIASAQDDGKVNLWYREGNTLSKLQWTDGKIKSVQLSPDASVLAVIGDNGTARLMRLGTLDQLLSLGCRHARESLNSNLFDDSDRRTCL